MSACVLWNVPPTLSFLSPLLAGAEKVLSLFCGAVSFFFSFHWTGMESTRMFSDRFYGSWERMFCKRGSVPWLKRKKEWRVLKSQFPLLHCMQRSRFSFQCNLDLQEWTISLFCNFLEENAFEEIDLWLSQSLIILDSLCFSSYVDCQCMCCPWKKKFFFKFMFLCFVFSESQRFCVRFSKMNDKLITLQAILCVLYIPQMTKYHFGLICVYFPYSVLSE